MGVTELKTVAGAPVANNYASNNSHPELDVPSMDISKIPNQEKIKTHYDPKMFTAPMDDPYLL